MLFLLFLSSGLFLGWSLGANDAANIFGTAVGSKMVRFRQAAVIASVFVILGAVFQGRGAALTLNELGAVDALAGAFTLSLVAGVVVLVMTKRGLPVSTSQAVVGGIVGWSIFTGNSTDIRVLSKIVGSWIAGPVLGMIFSYLLLILFRRLLKRAGIHLLKLDTYIRLALLVTGAFGAYSLGANNIANVVGVFVSNAPDIHLDFGLFVLDGQQLLFLIGSIAIASGIYTYSERVMNRVGNGILSLTPEAAIVVVLAHSLVLFLFSSTWLQNLLKSAGLPFLPMVPISSTQVVIGAVIGIGLVKHVREIDLRSLGGIAVGWVTTPVAAGVLTYFSLFFVQNVFRLPVTAVEETATSLPHPGSTVPSAAVIYNMRMPGLLLLAIVVIIAMLFLFFRQQKLRLRAENELLHQQNQTIHTQKVLSELETRMMHRQNELLNQQLEAKRVEFTNMALNITEQNEFLEKIAGELTDALHDPDPSGQKQKITHIIAAIRQHMSSSAMMNSFYGQVEQAHSDFLIRLSQRFPALTEQEKRLASLIRLNLSIKETATLMNIAPKSVEIARYRLRKKLNLEPGENLSQFLQTI